MPIAVLTALVVALKLPTLTTPAYWDEMAWLSQAAWLSDHNLLRALPGLRPDSVFWGHPPGLHLTGAALFKMFGASPTVGHVPIVGFAALGVVSTFLLARLWYDTPTAWLAALLLLLSPIYLAQSGMFLADIPVAGMGVTCVYLALTNRYSLYLPAATYMVFLKETSIALIVALTLYLCLAARPRTKAQWLHELRYGAPLIAIGAFFVLQRLTTGHFFVIYDFEFQFFDPTVDAVKRQFELVNEWIFVNQLRWLFTALIAAYLLWVSVRDRKEVWLFGLIVVFSGYSFSVLYFLPRYLLPTLPFFFILTAGAVARLVRPRAGRVAVAVLLVTAAAWSLVSQPFVGNSEFNLRYLDAVSVHEKMAQYIESTRPDARVLTAWPHTSQLELPLLGYTSRPVHATSFAHEGELGDSDLVLVSVPLQSNAGELEALALENGWTVIKKVAKGPIEARLYAPEGLP